MISVILSIFFIFFIVNFEILSTGWIPLSLLCFYFNNSFPIWEYYYAFKVYINCSMRIPVDKLTFFVESKLRWEPIDSQAYSTPEN